ncbi:hypothetical protein ES703_110886 [subsurface metagenome]
MEMIKQDPEVNAVVEKLKGGARASPWVPMGVPPRQHYHILPNGLTLCFTLDILPGRRYWHLSIARKPGGPTQEEIEFWRRAFFREEPKMTYPSRIAGGASRHFFWRYTA